MSTKMTPLLSACQQLAQTHPGLLLILVPRKPERFDEAEAKLRAARALRYVRRSEETIAAIWRCRACVLLDSIGELASLFPLADVVFMGGTLARRGGHNVLEPAACRKRHRHRAAPGKFRGHRVGISRAARIS